MSTQIYRFQCDAKNGVFTSAQIFDETIVQDPVTDEVHGSGNLLSPVTITDASHPALFAALNAIASKSADRLNAKREQLLAALADLEEYP